MKKLFLSALAVAAFSFTSCSSDDDGGGSSDGCQTCEMSLMGMEMVTEYCDNGDGTYTQTDDSGNESTEELPEGTTFDEMISGMEQAGMDCN